MTEVVPGYINYVTIKPTEIVGSNDIKEKLTPLQRNCRFSDELPENMTLFTKYSMEGCKFECMISIRYQHSTDFNLEKKLTKYIFP